MLEMYVSERLLKEVPNSLRNFLWYLFETYCPQDKEAFFLLKPDGESRLIITICSMDKTIMKNFGKNIDAKIVIHIKDSDYYMSYAD